VPGLYFLLSLLVSFQDLFDVSFDPIGYILLKSVLKDLRMTQTAGGFEIRVDLLAFKASVFLPALHHVVDEVLGFNRSDRNRDSFVIDFQINVFEFIFVEVILVEGTKGDHTKLRDMLDVDAADMIGGVSGRFEELSLLLILGRLFSQTAKYFFRSLNVVRRTQHVDVVEVVHDTVQEQSAGAAPGPFDFVFCEFGLQFQENFQTLFEICVMNESADVGALLETILFHFH